MTRARRRARSIVWPIWPWAGDTVIVEIKSAKGTAAIENAAAALAMLLARSLFS